MIMFLRSFVFIFLLVISVHCTNSNAKSPKSNKNQPKIVGGTQASIKRFSYQVSLLYDGNHVCGGTIIAMRFILTAAHCVVDMTASRFTVRGGSSRWKRGGVVAKVGLMVYHKFYNPKTNSNDIAIMRIVGSFNRAIKKNTVRIIPLLTKLPNSRRSLFVTGWGVRRTGSENVPFILRKVLLKYMPRKECNRLLNNRLNKRMICAGYPQGGKDACQGDSGGPLALENGKALIGVVSWGDGCGVPGKPGVYASVPFYVGWIQTVCKKWS